MNGIAHNNAVQYGKASWHKCKNLSILELSFRLKQAQLRVFGKKNDFVSENEDNELCDEEEEEEDEDFDSDDSDYYILKYKGKSITEINELYRKFDACFPRVIINNLDNDLDESFNDKSMISNKGLGYLETSGSKRHQCNFCNYCTDSKSHLIRHQRAMHPTYESTLHSYNKEIVDNLSIGEVITRKFKCDMCQYQTDCKSHLRRHVGSVHSKEKPYQCQLCSEEFSRSEKIKEHHYITHPEEPFDMKKSRKWFAVNSEVNKTVSAALNRMTKIKMLYEEADIDVKKEELEKIKNDSYMNSKCDSLESSNNEDDKRKVKRIRKKERRSFMCLKCDYKCRDIWHLKRHILDIHTTRKDNNCKVCQYASNRVHRLITHMRGHGELFCVYCNFSSTYQEIFNKHFQLCSAINKAQLTSQCKICNSDFETPIDLVQHAKTKHANSILFCSQCPYMTDNNLELQNHVSLHLFNNLVCLICNEIFESIEKKEEHDNQLHILVTSNLYSCTACSFQSSERIKVEEHILTHVGNQLVCQIDNCTFSCMGNLALSHHNKFFHKELQNNEKIETVSNPVKFRKPVHLTSIKKYKYRDKFIKIRPKPIQNESIDPVNSFYMGEFSLANKVSSPIPMSTSIKTESMDEWMCTNTSSNYNEMVANKIQEAASPIISPLRLYKRISKNMEVEEISLPCMQQSKEDRNVSTQLDSENDSGHKRRISASRKYLDYELESPRMIQMQAPVSSAVQLNFENLPASGIFNCPHCTERPPFRYRKSFEKHMATHNSV